MYDLLVARCYTEEQFRQLWHDEYVMQEIYTHDGIKVHFYDNNFDHAFYESTGRNVSKKSKQHKDVLSYQRLARIRWIKEVLVDKNAQMFEGYDKTTKKYSRKKRVAVVVGNYVVIIQMFVGKDGATHAKFITAYVADNSIDKILHSPIW